MSARTIPRAGPIPRACNCRPCRDRNERDYWHIVGAGWSACDEASIEDRIGNTPRAEWERLLSVYPPAALRALARGEDDGA